MERDVVMHGIRMLYCDFDRKDTKKIIQEQCIDKGMNYIDFTFRVVSDKPEDDIPAEYFTDLARYLTDNHIYFAFHYQHRKRNSVGTVKGACGFEKETAVEMKQIAGEYFLGYKVGELGSEYGCYGANYAEGWDLNQSDNAGIDLKEVKENVDAKAREAIEAASMDGEIPVTVIEATGLLPYISAQGTAYPTFEGMCGNPEIMTALTRATAKLLHTDIWGTYIAHEWYGGVRAFDPLKMHRLRMMYDYVYLSGGKTFMIESGNDGLNAHGVTCGYDHPVCQKYREVMDEFADFINHDNRPKGGPKVKVAFVQGNYDGYSPWRAGSYLWNCFSQRDFSYSAPELMWRIFDDIPAKRQWHDIHNFGENDLSNAPAYGTYDIVMAGAGNEIFSKYDYLIFAGWNSMTEEIYEELKKFVHGGGRLFLTAAHLNTSVKRDGVVKLIKDGAVEDLFGCKLSAEEAFETNDGWKYAESIVPELMYPRAEAYDPVFSEGHIKYAKTEPVTANPAGVLSSRFFEADRSRIPVGLVENKYGDGYAILMTCLDYPSGSGYSAYRTIVREILTASHRQAHIKVCAPDKVRFSVYEGDKVYLLNTDFDCGAHVVVDYGTKKKEISLKPRELYALEP